MDQIEIKVDLGDEVAINGYAGTVTYVGKHGFTAVMELKDLPEYSVLHNGNYRIIRSPKKVVKKLWTRVFR